MAARACLPKDAADINRLYRKYVGSGPIDVARLKLAVRRETAAADARATARATA
jgi:hypothetical protein